MNTGYLEGKAVPVPLVAHFSLINCLYVGVTDKLILITEQVRTCFCFALFIGKLVIFLCQFQLTDSNTGTY